MTFYVGQKVVALATWTPDWSFPNAPVKGTVYTIRLFELVNPISAWRNVSPREAAFAQALFRPVVERKTSIEIFEKLLVPPERVKERA